MCAWDPHRMPSHEWEVVIEGNYPSQNDLGGNHRTGYKYRKVRNTFAKLLKKPLNAIPAAHRFRAGIITREYGLSEKGAQKRRYDEENLVGGGKPLVDVLRDYGVILNDTQGAWRGYYRQYKSPDGIDRIRIQLMEYND